MKLAIQIILYKNSDVLGELLHSLEAQTFRDFTVFFYDNSANVSEVIQNRKLVETAKFPYQLSAGEKNIGFAGGHAAMFAMHDAPFVMLLNDDAKLDPGYLQAAMQRIESDERIASVTGLIYRWNEKTIDSSGMEYRCMARVLDRHTAPESAGEVFGVSGALGLYRRSAIEKAGGYLFDPEWFMYKEDVDLALRLYRAGFTSWYEPRAIAWHKRGFKEDKPGILRRFMSERKRPALLRQYAYTNQHHVYTLHAAPSLGFKDFFLSLINELGRSFLVFVTSPIVWTRSVVSLAKTFSRFWKKRKELERLGLPHRRVLL